MYRAGLSTHERQDYLRGIKNLRGLIDCGRERDDWLRREHRDPLYPEQIQVRVTAASIPDAHVDVRLRTTDLYITSVHNKHAGFYFSDSYLNKTLEKQRILGFTGHYKDLGDFISLEEINPSVINGAIISIANWSSSIKITSKIKDRNGESKQSAQARHILVLCLIVSESMRFPAVSNTVANSLVSTNTETALDKGHGKSLTLGEIDREVHKWGQASIARDYDRVAVMNVDKS